MISICRKQQEPFNTLESYVNNTFKIFMSYLLKKKKKLNGKFYNKMNIYAEKVTHLTELNLSYKFVCSG